MTSGSDKSKGTKLPSKSVDKKSTATLANPPELLPPSHVNQKISRGAIINVIAGSAAILTFLWAIIEFWRVQPLQDEVSRLEHQISMFEPRIADYQFRIENEVRNNEILTNAIYHSRLSNDSLRLEIENLRNRLGEPIRNPNEEQTRNRLVLIKNQISKGERIKALDAREDETYDSYTQWRNETIGIIQSLPSKKVSQFEASFSEVTNLKPEEWINIPHRIDNGIAILRTISNNL